MTFILRKLPPLALVVVLTGSTGCGKQKEEPPPVQVDSGAKKDSAQGKKDSNPKDGKPMNGDEKPVLKRDKDREAELGAQREKSSKEIALVEQKFLPMLSKLEERNSPLLN